MTAIRYCIERDKGTKVFLASYSHYNAILLARLVYRASKFWQNSQHAGDFSIGF